MRKLGQAFCSGSSTIPHVEVQGVQPERSVQCVAPPTRPLQASDREHEEAFVDLALQWNPWEQRRASVLHREKKLHFELTGQYYSFLEISFSLANRIRCWIQPKFSAHSLVSNRDKISHQILNDRTMLYVHMGSISIFALSLGRIISSGGSFPLLILVRCGAYPSQWDVFFLDIKRPKIDVLLILVIRPPCRR